MSQTIYERIGGFSTVQALVEDFYERVLRIESLRHYFAGVDMSNLVRHQTDFFCMVLGGPVRYSGRQLREAHRHLSIAGEDFDRVVDTLKECHLDAGVEDE